MDHFAFLEPDKVIDREIVSSYTPELVIVSILIAIFASYVAYLVSMRIQDKGFNSANLKWSIFGAMALGSGIWSMHFVGMLAYRLPIAVNYDIQMTLISIIPGILASFIVVLTNSRQLPGFKSLLMRGILMGLGIASMHYIGMSATRIEGTILIDLWIFWLSIILAIVLSVASLKLKLWAENNQTNAGYFSPGLVLASIVMGSVISSMHYISMAAMHVYPNSASHVQTMIWQPVDLTVIISIVILWIGLILIIAINVSKRFDLYQQMKESSERQAIILNTVADAIVSIDGSGIIQSFNPSAEKIFGYQAKEVISRHIEVLIPDKKLEFQDLKKTILDKHVYSEDYLLHEFEGCRKNGSRFILEMSLTPVSLSKNLGFVGIMRDITRRKQAQDQLSFQARHDALTGLVNRHEFERYTKNILSTIRQDKNEHALCFMDLDQFKIVNDTCGHSAGDELLRQIGKVLSETIRKGDMLARLGGDEFGVLMQHCSIDQAQRVTNSLLQNVKDFVFIWNDQSFRIGVSIGLVSVTEDTTDYDELLKQADEACYMAKDSGRNRIQIYNPLDTEITQRQGEMQWITRIHTALEENRLCLYAQPIVPLDKSDQIHFEILIRMLDKDNQVIPPGAFLPAAERYNLIEVIDSWVIKKAFAFLQENPDFEEKIHFISINLSGPSLTNSGFLEFISTQLRITGVNPAKICFEVTETVAITNLSAATIFIGILKEIGCHFALDDFGSGLSSFGYLKTLPVDYLKIDGMFVKDMVSDPIDHAMVKSINEIGHVMGMKTIAEYVENDEIFEKLSAIGVNYAQGYGVGKPEPFGELIKHVLKQKK